MHSAASYQICHTLFTYLQREYFALHSRHSSGLPPWQGVRLPLGGGPFLEGAQREGAGGARAGRRLEPHEAAGRARQVPDAYSRPQGCVQGMLYESTDTPKLISGPRTRQK